MFCMMFDMVVSSHITLCIHTGFLADVMPNYIF